MPCIVPAVMPNSSFEQFLMQEALAVTLTVQKFRPLAGALASCRVCGLCCGTGDGAGSCL